MKQLTYVKLLERECKIFDAFLLSYCKDAALKKRFENLKNIINNKVRNERANIYIKGRPAI